MLPTQWEVHMCLVVEPLSTHFGCHPHVLLENILSITFRKRRITISPEMADFECWMRHHTPVYVLGIYKCLPDFYKFTSLFE